MKTFKQYIKEQEANTNPVSRRSDMINKIIVDQDKEAAEHEVDTLARTLDGEARGESDEGMAAVAHVINNRSRNTGYYPSEIARQNKQFSTWNSDDPNRERIENLPSDSEEYQRAHRIAREVLDGRSEDPTGGATHYYNPNIANPDWSSSMQGNTAIGNHLFGNIPGEYDGQKKARTYDINPNVTTSPRPRARPDRPTS